MTGASTAGSLGRTEERRLARLASRLMRTLWGDRDARRRLQEAGVNLLPADWYGNAPTLLDIERSFEYSDPQNPPYLDRRLFEHERLGSVIDELVPFAAELNPPAEAQTDETVFFWGNSQFSYCDAMAYYCMLRRHRPQTVVEVGCGYSTLVARAALRKNGDGRLICVEPHPRPFLANLSDVELITARAETLGVDFFSTRLRDGDFLVIDSTHTVKTGSDCLHLYLRVLPHVGRELLVHAHDIFLPWGLPQKWMLDLHIHWTEQYLLLALLTDNPRATVLFGSAYNEVYHHAGVERLMGGKWPSGGGSLWWRYDAR